MTLRPDRAVTSSLERFTVLLLLWSPALATAQAPIPVVERRVEVGNRIVRTTLFSNRVAVVSVRLDGDQVALRQMTLPDGEYTGYLAALLRDAAELARAERQPATEQLGGRAEITLHVGPDAPRMVVYSPVEVLDLVTSRLVAALDDLERRVIWGEPSEAELEGWDPRQGDRVELRTGVLATVVDIADNGALVLEHDETGTTEIVAPDQRSRFVLRVLEEEP
jgi:hypothetical protein